MMKIIHKFNIRASPGLDSLQIPGFVDLLLVKKQYGKVMAYALVDSAEPERTIHIQIISTGGDSVFDDFQFLGTVVLEDGA